MIIALATGIASGIIAPSVLGRPISDILFYFGFAAGLLFSVGLYLLILNVPREKSQKNLAGSYDEG